MKKLFLLVCFFFLFGCTVGEFPENRNRLHEMGRDIWVVTEDEGYAIPDGAEEIRLPASPEWWMSPLFNQVPVSLLAGYMCELRHEAYGRGVKGPWAVCGTTDLLTKSVRESWD